MQDESSQPEPIVMGIEHIEAANPERVIAALRRLISHLAASDPDDQEPADVIMVAVRRRYGDQVRDQIASNFEPQEGSGVFRGSEVRAEGERITDLIVSQDAEGKTKPVQRADGERPAALHGSLYLDRGERMEKAREQIDKIKGMVERESATPADFYFDVYYGKGQRAMAERYVTEIEVYAREAFPGITVSCGASLASGMRRS